jgi:peptide/nickel transport system substrate-binding protein
MKAPKKALALASVVAAAVFALAACGSSGTPSGGATGGTGSTGGTSSSTTSSGGAAVYDAASSGIVNPSTTTGGTMNLVSTADCDSWDPARTYYGWCWNMQRLFTRTLVGWQTVNGTDFKLAPDLATGLGKSNAAKTEWTYTLKPGLKFSNGQPITPEDVKYGIERLYAGDQITGGPSFYFTTIINAPKNYAGPYKDGDLPDSAISTTNDSITFHLNSPFGDFDDIMALPTAAPVPAKVEGGPQFKGGTYGKHPVSSGPYMIKSYTPNQSISFVRNPDWDQSTDTIRHPLADEIDLTVDTNSDDADAKLLDGTYDANASAALGTTARAKVVTSPSMKANADDPVSAFTSYLNVIPSVIPNIDCRKAIFYAVNKAAYLQAYGGEYAGVVAGSMTPPGIEGNDPTANPYPTGADNTGDADQAKAELQKCGQPNGFTTKIAYRTSPAVQKQLAISVQSALAKVGIKADLVGADAASYYSTFIGSPQNLKNQGLGITLNGWGADFPTPYGFFFSIDDGKAIADTANYNTASLNDPTVNGVLEKALKGSATEDDYKNMDKAIMASATSLPMVWGKNLYYRNPRLTNVTSNNAQAFGIYDFVNAGVS